MTAPRPSVSGQRRPGAGIALAPGRLTRLRQEKSWEREDLAAATGLSVSAITKIENRERRPRAATLAVICTAIGCTPADLLPEPEPTQQTALALAVLSEVIRSRPQALSLNSKNSRKQQQ